MDPSKFSKCITPLSFEVLDTKPSCLEFVPPQHNPGSQYFIVGTYTLLEDEDPDADKLEEDEPASHTVPKPQVKTGSLKLFRLKDDRQTLVQELVYESAIFDLHFLPGSPFFAVVTNTGDISILKFSQDDQDSCGFRLIATHHLIDSQITYFAWYPHYGENPPLLAATLDTGRILILRFGDWEFSKVELLVDDQNLLAGEHAHTESAWCCAWSPLTSPTLNAEPRGTSLLSGGDDCTMRLFSTDRTPITPNSSLIIKDEESLKTASTIFKPHSSGVTFILPLPIADADEACILLTGGYDDVVRVYATYDFRPSSSSHEMPQVLAALKLGGGVWRLRYLHEYTPPTDTAPYTYRVLASCAGAGARILEVEGSKFGEWKISVVGSVTIHESMCYASDVQPIPEGEDISRPRVCVSTSFYDKLLCVWRWDPAQAVVEDSSRP